MSPRIDPVFFHCGPLPAHCPCCGVSRRLMLYRAGERLTVRGWPLPLPVSQYIAVCPRCASVYRVAPPAAQLGRQGSLPDPEVPSRCLRRLRKGERLFPQGFVYRKKR